MLPLEIELSEEERDRILDAAADRVARRRMEMPAVLALELHRPLTFLSSQALIVFTPLLAPAFGLENLQKLSRLLEDRANVDRLIERIEARAAAADGGAPEADGAQAG
jgi:acyl-CoA reductase-like NAD-dependent aldehyde dehydrogenase